MKDKIMIVGSGGREHALGWKLGQSDNVAEVIYAPGNAGTMEEKGRYSQNERGNLYFDNKPIPKGIRL